MCPVFGATLTKYFVISMFPMSLVLIYLLTAIGATPGDSITVHIYTKIIEKQN
jgi:uncharacterized BrkB/YihY/UPF0761 family membrane protein